MDDLAELIDTIFISNVVVGCLCTVFRKYLHGGTNKREDVGVVCANASITNSQRHSASAVADTLLECTEHDAQAQVSRVLDLVGNEMDATFRNKAANRSSRQLLVPDL